jgi:hypothetical protein
MDAHEKSALELDLARQVRNIRANADLVLRSFTGVTDFPFGYNEKSVQWLDTYIEHIRTTDRSEEEFNQLVANLGSFLGEALIAAFGGSWSLDQRGLVVHWDEMNRAYPFAKVAGQLKNGNVDSIYSFYAVTKALRNA